MSTRHNRKLSTALIGFLLLSVSLAACAPAAPTPAPTASPMPMLAISLPGDGAIADWKISVPAKAYTHDTLFDLVDGQADGFFVYNFQQVTTQRYTNAAGALLNVEVWQLAQPDDAYGLFTLSRAGTPAKMGNEGDADPGRRLAFWQSHFYVNINATQAVPDDQIAAFGLAITKILPTGGQTPALVGALPAQGLANNGAIFFHQELSIQDQVYLGGNNLLGLSPATNGVVGTYTLDGGPAHLMLIQYPAADGAAAGLAALRKTTDMSLIAADVKGRALGAVFGQAGQAAAKTLLQSALAGVQP